MSTQNQSYVKQQIFYFDKSKIEVPQKKNEANLVLVRANLVNLPSFPTKTVVKLPICTYKRKSLQKTEKNKTTN